jgi:DNA-binding MarR family transcriptional regulator
MEHLFGKQLGASTGLAFIRVYNHWHSRIKAALQETGITHPQFVALSALAYLGTKDAVVTQVDVARIAQMDVMTVSQVVRRLEAGGYLQRQQHPTDTRAYALTLLEKGQKVLRTAVPAVESVDDEVFGQLGAREENLRDLLIALLP